MRYALYKYDGVRGVVNIGDFIQSLAAKQYLPKVDFFVERDHPNRKTEPAKIIMNGWHTYRPENWPPNSNLIPLLTSFHLNPNYAEQFFSCPKTLEYLRANAPIGCRDFTTLHLMEKYNVNAYYSLCLTTTLDKKYKAKEKTGDILFVDPLFEYDKRWLYKLSPQHVIAHILSGKLSNNLRIKRKKEILKSLVNSDVLSEAKTRSIAISSWCSTERKFKMAEDALDAYNRAKLIVTSRIHCALPCLAFKTPVLFVLDGLEADVKENISRFDGVLDHVNILTSSPEEVNMVFGKKMNTIHPLEIDWENPPANPTSYLAYANRLRAICEKFIRDGV